ncbi:hypothetical protein [Clostridium coskatii]|uniref:Uncharacterized protein n=1 Tax=Clostridium coskatii TaxID=1705578 RepID=A0A162LC93_9CLOT|nr:hypothetical protein [Clostridium coskatii]OAA94102.1 hypothetical protein WX73_03672 [Clostridium coskatii]OBR96664.1 hypothetical protein CLCOS_08260 [Clostridium coskatii]
MSKEINKEELMQKLIKTFNDLIDYAMYMKMVTKFDGGIRDNLLLDSCEIIAKIKESGLFEKEGIK